MGQKVNPTGIRVGINKEWPSRWYATKKDFGTILGEDVKIRDYFERKYNEAGISKVLISRNSREVTITVKTSKVGLVLGKGGEKSDIIEKAISKIVGKKIRLEVESVEQPELDAVIVAEAVCRRLEGREPFRRVAKMAVQDAMKNGAKGAKVLIGGRLGGAEMARSEFFTEGSVPLQTLRADISYAYDRAETIYGTFGVKVWIYNGDRFDATKEQVK
jgi:small subunit ribosomal protein S3